MTFIEIVEIKTYYYLNNNYCLKGNPLLESFFYFA